jgi:hypothetical protein
MMRLALALYAEGNTDNHFLPLIIRRTSRKILAEHEQSHMNVAPIEPIKLTEKKHTRDENILQAARQAVRYQALIVHSDADYPSPERALKERILPGFHLVQQHTKGSVCEKLLPIIPVQMTEAWMLAADHDLLREVIGTSIRAQDLGLVNRVRLVESDPDPKQTLKQIIHRAYTERSRRHREVDLSSLYAPLGRRISLDRLSNVPSYKRFVDDLTATLRTLNLIK